MVKIERADALEALQEDDPTAQRKGVDLESKSRGKRLEMVVRMHMGSCKDATKSVVCSHHLPGAGNSITWLIIMFTGE